MTSEGVEVLLQVVQFLLKLVKDEHFFSLS